MTPEQQILEMYRQIDLLTKLILDLEDEIELIYSTEIKKPDTTTGAS